MTTLIRGFFDIMISSLNSDFVVVPVLSAVVASLTFLIIGIVKERG